MIFTKQLLNFLPIILYGAGVVTANPVPGIGDSLPLKPLEIPGPQFPDGFAWSAYTPPEYADSCNPHIKQLDKYFSEALHIMDYVVGMKDEYRNQNGNAYKAFMDLGGNDDKEHREKRFNDVIMVFRKMRQNLIKEIDERKGRVKVSCGVHEHCKSGSGKGYVM